MKDVFVQEGREWEGCSAKWARQDSNLRPHGHERYSGRATCLHIVLTDYVTGYHGLIAKEIAIHRPTDLSADIFRAFEDVPRGLSIENRTRLMSLIGSRSRGPETMISISGISNWKFGLMPD
jgi:hypothetical protein